MRRFAVHLAIVGIGALVSAPVVLEAQYRPGLSPEWRLPPPSTPELTVPATGMAQAQRLPVYDDAGGLISFEAIQARVDRSGLKGAFWGGLAGSLGGVVLGVALSTPDCPRQEGGFNIHCSPREEALQGAVPGGLSLVGMMALAWLGWSADVTTWQDAVTDIRRERGGAAR